jgi:tyrosyl-tRNA synthetase
MDLVKELKWRGMVHDYMPGTDEQLNKEPTCLYLGIDPTADSLHIGHLASIMLLKQFQMAGHKPIILIGGATGMIGDPSGKSKERNLLSIEKIRYNQQKIKEQLNNFLSFENVPNPAEMVNNYDWMNTFGFLDFIRDVGKHITVSYMMAKDSVKNRLESGLSFTEFSYQLVQGYDFLYLNKEKNCKLQIGGADQWGNITTGTELIRRMNGGEAYALTCPLITKADGGKFGKTEKGNIWLDPELTSPYKFYQFWLNVSDEDAENYIKVFTVLTKEKINALIEEHHKNPHLRLLQKELAKQTTIMVHSEEAYHTAIEASNVLFGKATIDSLNKIDEQTFLAVFEGVPMYEINRAKLEKGIVITDLLTDSAPVFSSKGELKRLVAGGGLSVNKAKIIDQEHTINTNNLVNNKYILVQKGKKNYFLIKVI